MASALGKFAYGRTYTSQCPMPPPQVDNESAGVSHKTQVIEFMSNCALLHSISGLYGQ